MILGFVLQKDKLNPTGGLWKPLSERITNPEKERLSEMYPLTTLIDWILFLPGACLWLYLGSLYDPDRSNSWYQRLGIVKVLILIVVLSWYWECTLVLWVILKWVCKVSVSDFLRGEPKQPVFFDEETRMFYWIGQDDRYHWESEPDTNRYILIYPVRKNLPSKEHNYGYTH